MYLGTTTKNEYLVLIQLLWKNVNSYDALSRLTRADYASGGADRDWFRVENLQYDRQGNILTLNRNDEEGTAIDQLNYNYSGTNRLQNVGDAYGSTPSLDWDAEPASFDYDPNGNLIARAENSADSTLFDYDHRNLPLKVTLPDGGSARFRYTADGQRYLKEASGEETFYILDGSQTLAVMKDSTLSWWNLTGTGVEGRWETASDSLRFYVTDHLGSTRAVVDNDGTVLESFDYYPFGLLMPKRNTTGAGTMEKYTGHEFDDEAGLSQYHMVWRRQDPALGRFLSVDPHHFNYPNLSPYNYVGNNPISYVDPFGLDFYRSEDGAVLWADTDEEEYVKDGVTGTTFLSFDGESLVVHNQVEDKEGNRSVESTVFEARSGVPNKITGKFDYSDDYQKIKNFGPTPEGLYQLGRTGYAEDGGNFRPGYKDPKGRAYYIDLNPVGHNAKGRTGLEIHPDGNNPGTAGCIGIQCQIPDLPQQFYDAIEKTLIGIPLKKRPFLNVKY